MSLRDTSCEPYNSCRASKALAESHGSWQMDGRNATAMRLAVRSHWSFQSLTVLRADLAKSQAAA